MIFFSAEFSSTYFDYVKNEVKDRELYRTQDFGVGGISISLVLQSNLSKYF